MKTTQLNNLVVGASGLIGRELIAAFTASGSGVIALSRRPLKLSHRKITERIVDFKQQWQSWALPPADCLYCALGTTIKTAGSQEAFRAVEFDAVIASAHAAKAAGVTRMAVVSALGASQTSSVFYSRTKGEMEEALKQIGFSRLVIVRPSFLTGDRASLGQAARPGESIALTFANAFNFMTPKKYRSVSAVAVARCMIDRLQSDGPAVETIESGNIPN